MTDEYLQLDRVFHPLPPAEDGEAYDVQSLSGFGKQLTWPGLLQTTRAVILFEAGAGKAVEIREAARRLRAEHKPAFFVRVPASLKTHRDRLSSAMVTVHRAHGLRIVIFVDDHEPAHVHVFGDGEAKINLAGGAGDPDLIFADGMSRADIRRIMRVCEGAAGLPAGTVERDSWLNFRTPRSRPPSSVESTPWQPSLGQRQRATTQSLSGSSSS